ncbi:hypothetical protein ABKN59_011135 [Abortiporus biennis]
MPWLGKGRPLSDDYVGQPDGPALFGSLAVFLDEYLASGRYDSVMIEGDDIGTLGAYFPGPNATRNHKR